MERLGNCCGQGLYCQWCHLYCLWNGSQMYTSKQWWQSCCCLITNSLELNSYSFYVFYRNYVSKKMGCSNLENVIMSYLNIFIASGKCTLCPKTFMCSLGELPLLPNVYAWSLTFLLVLGPYMVSCPSMTWRKDCVLVHWCILIQGQTWIITKSTNELLSNLTNTFIAKILRHRIS